MAEILPFGEGASINRPPLFCGLNYQLWKVRMKFFVESIDRKIWNVITNSYLMPISENVSSEREHLDCVAMNIIVSALDSNEFLKVSECSSAKEMWNTLEEYHQNPRSALMDIEESFVKSFSSESRKEVCLMTKEDFGSSQAAGNKNCQYSSDESEEETFRLLFKQFSKAIKKRNNKSDSSNRYDNKKPIEFNTNKYTCFGCGEQGHIKTECPNQERKNFKKHEKKRKSRRAYNNDTSSSSSSDEEEANLCLMTRQESDTSSVSSSTSINFENYSQLIEAFNETHEEANRLALLNKRLKCLNNSLENRVKILEEELDNSKTDFENLEMIYQNSSCKCVGSSSCENCESLQKKVHYLLKTMNKFSKGQSNLETVLASQKCVFGKAGLGFNPNINNKSVSKPFSSFFFKNNLLFYRNNRLKFVITA